MGKEMESKVSSVTNAANNGVAILLENGIYIVTGSESVTKKFMKEFDVTTFQGQTVAPAIEAKLKGKKIKIKLE
ncbi:MAG: hypothetical protein ABIA93_02660 [Candidatus Woesearchaeota archaeon]